MKKIPISSKKETSDPSRLEFQRVYRDPKVGNVLRAHTVEVEADVVQRAWLAETGWISALERPDDPP